MSNHEMELLRGRKICLAEYLDCLRTQSVPEVVAVLGAQTTHANKRKATIVPPSRLDLHKVSLLVLCICIIMVADNILRRKYIERTSPKRQRGGGYQWNMKKREKVLRKGRHCSYCIYCKKTNRTNKQTNAPSTKLSGANVWKIWSKCFSKNSSLYIKDFRLYSCRL